MCYCLKPSKSSQANRGHSNLVDCLTAGARRCMYTRLQRTISQSQKVPPTALLAYAELIAETALNRRFQLASIFPLFRSLTIPNSTAKFGNRNAAAQGQLTSLRPRAGRPAAAEPPKGLRWLKQATERVVRADICRFLTRLGRKDTPRVGDRF